MPKFVSLYAVTIFFFTCLASTIHGQNNMLDSLKKKISNNKENDTTLYRYNFQKAIFLYSKQNDSAKYYLDKSFKLATQLHYYAGFADYYHFLAVSLNQKELYDSAMIMTRQEKYWAEKSADKSRLIVSYNDMGNLNLDSGNEDSAAIYFLKALPIAEHLGNEKLASNICYNLSAAYYALDDYTTGLSYAKKSFAIAQKINNTHNMVNSLLNWASISAKMGNTDTALVIFNHVKEIIKNTADSIKIMDILNNEGEILFDQKKYYEALKIYNNFLRIAKNYNDPGYLLYAYANRGHTLLKVKSYEKAEENLLQSLQLAKQLKANDELLNIYYFYSELKEQSKDYQTALAFWKKADSLKAIFSKEQSGKDIHRLEIQYQASQKDKFIAQQKLAIAENKNIIQKKNALNIGLIAGSLLLLLTGLLIYLNFKNRHQLLKKEKKLQEHKIIELEKQQQLLAMQSVLKGQEEERSRLARDLHDGVGGLLSGVKLSMSTMKGNVFLSEENALSFGNVINQLDQSIAELRRVSHNMMPEALIKFGLKEALENYCENLNHSGKIKVQLQAYGMEQRMEQNTEIIVYRIVQELLNNVIKHAEAKNVLIQMVREGEHFNLTVEDDGKGFDINKKITGAGLANVKARTEYLDGSVDIVSKKGEGTSVLVEGKCSPNAG